MNEMKKIGVITMHRVQNFGSVLQAYALSEKLNRLGADCEIIDYQYPNAFHLSSVSTVKRSFDIGFFIKRIKYFILYRNSLQKRRFSDFLNSTLKTSRYYPTRQSLKEYPPMYDVYITGSDQVWNPYCMKGDDTFLLGFINDRIKASYASSFSVKQIPTSYFDVFKNYLSQYQHIGVREASSVRIIEELTGKRAVTVCDPTLLLRKDDYRQLALQSQIMIRHKYILVYALSYAYNPNPQLGIIVDRVKKELNLPVVYLHSNDIEGYHCGASITSAGPKEFLSLFMDAEFIITSSFHGTSFSLIFEKPFIAITPGAKTDDDRIGSLLRRLSIEQQAISVDQVLPSELPLRLKYDEITPRLELFRQESEAFLIEVLSK